MDSDLFLLNNLDSLKNENPRSIYAEYELNIVNKIILLLSGYDTSPFYGTCVEDGHFYQVGMYPDVLEISSKVNTPHVSASAITSLLKELAHFGSAIHLLNRLNDALSEAYKDSKDKPLAPSLVVLMLEEPTVLNGQEHGPKDSYDWYWKDNFEGFCTAINIIFNDWRLIMFKIQEKYFKAVYSQNGEWNLHPNFIRNLDELTSPVFELLDRHKFVSDSKDSRILDLYVNVMPFLEIMESLTNLIELFLNYLKNNSIDKSEMPNAMLTLLMVKIRTSEMTNDKSMTKIWRFLLYYTFRDRKDYVLTLTTQNMFSIFEEVKAKAKQISENIEALDPRNLKKNHKLLFDRDLKKNLLRICGIDSDSIEFKLISYLNPRFKKFIALGMGMTESILKNKYNYHHYLYLLNSIVLSQFGDNAFITKSILKEKRIKSLFDRICVDQLKTGSSVLSELDLEELSYIMARIKIDRVGAKYVIGVVGRRASILFQEETMDMYSAIFNHVLEFLRFKENVEVLINECKWRTNKSTHRAPQTVLILANLSTSLVIYFKLIIDHFWDDVNRVNHGTTMEEIRRRHLNHLTILYTFLFVRGSSEVYFSSKAGLIAELIGKIFKMARELTSLTAIDPSSNSETSDKIKTHYNEIVSTLDGNLIDEFVDYVNWIIFADDKHSLVPTVSAKTALHSTLSLLKSLLSFNHTPE
ncbi:hypothetical protein MACK_000863 [Theileria orientalis]|uniref:Uncharacterized protein n=1 Tax=Theileria orientalis TaxID=68886 RepID=A0A976QSF4_THEOR|nr:hypothetical protein MACK_000863 [Theileria orientalis]